MRIEPETPEDHRQRSDFIKLLVQRSSSEDAIGIRYQHSVPKIIVQYWHNLKELPDDIDECISSWRSWENKGFVHQLFDEHSARSFIKERFGARHERAFDRCYHPAMQSDYFRLCFLSANGGFYVDADDVCLTTNIDWLFEDGRLKLQPLCYDIPSGTMVKPADFLPLNADNPGWIFYFNNNPLVATHNHPIVDRALDLATHLLESEKTGAFPEIQATTGPGNISKSVFDFSNTSDTNLFDEVVVLKDWDSHAISKWPLSYREDARNWRLSNQKKFEY